MKRNLEVALIGILALGAIALPILGFSSVQSIEAMKASHIDWPKLLLATSLAEQARDRLDVNKPESLAEARALVKESLDQMQTANWPKSFRIVDRDLIDVLQTLDGNQPAESKVAKARADLTNVRRSIVSDSRELAKAGRPRIVAAETRSWLTMLMGLQALLTMILAIYCLHERNKHQKLLTIANLTLEKANQDLEQLSRTDPLTGLLNRRGLEICLEDEKHRARRSGKAIVVVLIDCDNFKQVNESYGHSGGDETLRVVAQRMRQTMRSTDHFCRVGGDEFLILCPETDLPSSKPVLERLLAAIADEPIAFADKQIAATVSAGAAQLPPEVASVDDILRLTRESLQGSKITGKNKVQFAG